ncbi:hypothetical protein BDV98DRAFT_561185, partial [Pterulicium gracile]
MYHIVFHIHFHRYPTNSIPPQTNSPQRGCPRHSASNVFRTRMPALLSPPPRHWDLSHPILLSTFCLRNGVFRRRRTSNRRPCRPR